MARSALLNIMIQAARKAARELSRDFGEVAHLQVSLKGPDSFVVATRKRSEKVLIETLQKSRPGYCFLTNETGSIEGADKSHRWILAPLDGAENFLHALPVFAISIALEREGQLVSGLVYNPASNDLFTTEKGKGVFLNDRRMRVATRRNLDEALIMCDMAAYGSPSPSQRLCNTEPMINSYSLMRVLGSAAISLAFTAIGRADAYVGLDADLCSIAAGILMVREAGGFVSHFEKQHPDQNTANTPYALIAGNESLHKSLMRLLQLNPMY